MMDFTKVASLPEQDVFDTSVVSSYACASWPFSIPLGCPFGQKRFHDPGFLLLLLPLFASLEMTRQHCVGESEESTLEVMFAIPFHAYTAIVQGSPPNPEAHSDDAMLQQKFSSLQVLLCFASSSTHH